MIKYGFLFKKIKLDKQQVKEMINYVIIFDELINGFKYNANVLDLLQIINDKIDLIKIFYS